MRLRDEEAQETHDRATLAADWKRQLNALEDSYNDTWPRCVVLERMVTYNAMFARVIEEKEACISNLQKSADSHREWYEMQLAQRDEKIASLEAKAECGS